MSDSQDRPGPAPGQPSGRRPPVEPRPADAVPGPRSSAPSDAPTWSVGHVDPQAEGLGPPRDTASAAAGGTGGPPPVDPGAVRDTAAP
ncbi:MAG: hypothetical protein NXH83_15525, partial [Rhodobacteraceae bacterium]|nr:hypothetical protein [Paracoccaceae bacterium]